MNELQLVVSKQFDGFTLDCYIEPNQSDKGAFWATRTQIGQLLGYENPNEAIAIIHHRNKERLDKFSALFTLKRVEGERTVAREVTVYNFMGLLEICRYSQQETANAVIDMLWAIADEIRRTGSYNPKMDAEDRELKLKELDDRRAAIDLERAKMLQRMIDTPIIPLSDESKAVIQHEAFKILTGSECLSMLPQVHDKYYTATQLGEMFGVSSKKIGKIAKVYGLKSEEGEPSEFGHWILTKSPYSCHQCSSFTYNSHAVDWLNEHTELLA